MIELGVITPIVTLVPGAHAPWEREGTVDDVVRIARAADELGCHHVTASEHVALPASMAATRGARYWDPVATLGHLAAVTERIRLVPSVVVLGYHHPLEIVKRYGTLDLLSGGRLTLGVGVGSLAEEFELLDAPFADRGDRADDALDAIRAAWAAGAEPSSFTGRFHEWSDQVVDPSGVQDHLPVWVGGRTARSLRRAVEKADGWCPFGVAPDDVTAMLAAARATDAWSARVRPLEIVLQSQRAFDPLGHADAAAAELDALVAAGATHVAARLVSRSLHHYLDQLSAMVELSRRAG